jgi:cyclopropane-fatty-acyl-phospholipid synthase
VPTAPVAGRPSLLPGVPALDHETLRRSGSSPAAIAAHYDLPTDFFATWLGPGLVYSCACWDADDPGQDLSDAQDAKIDYFASELGVRGKRLLDVGCGWGALVRACVDRHGAAAAVGLTLSESQRSYALDHRLPRTEVRLESWVDHEPDAPYDVITCIEATEHLASDHLGPDDKLAVYAAFFERLASWLVPEGRIGLQLICLDDVSHAASRPGRGPLSELIRTEIFPEAMSGALSQLALAWEPHFRLERFGVHPDHYARTFRAWNLALRAHRREAAALVDAPTLRAVERYLAAGEALFRLGEQTLYRVVLRRRPAPKSWRSPLRPALVDAAAVRPAPPPASREAVQAHYDLSNDFFALWLDPSMTYSSGLWEPGDPDSPDILEVATRRKVGFFLDALDVPAGGRLLDVGCGWGAALAHALDRQPDLDAVGLTLSAAQKDRCEQVLAGRADVRLEAWQEHRPPEPYDGILSFGAFEHFARDGSRSVDRVLAYRRFFAACHSWLAPGARLGLETIAHDDAPDTAAVKGRGPLGDAVLDLFPESLCPHLAEIVLGFEPWFRLDLLRSDPADFARTFRAWSVRLRGAELPASALVGAAAVRTFRRYLASSEVQFRTGALTNYRLVLRRRDVPHLPASPGSGTEGMDAELRDH